MPSHKISLKQAVLININIMLSTGIFLNGIPLVKMAGSYSPLIYLIIGILITPLIFGVSELLKIFPSGSFYHYAKETLGQNWGFLSAWSYFTDKLASATIMTHFGVTILQNLFPALQIFNVFALDTFIILLFTALNLQNLRTGSKIQMMFLVLKSIPVLSIVLTGLYAVSAKGVYFVDFSAFNLALGIPLVIYAFSGFEACCSISRHMENSKKNAPRALIISYMCAVGITILYQFVFSQLVSKFAALNNNLAYCDAFPIILKNLPLGAGVLATLLMAFQVFIALSALGGAYGIFFSNNWNLYSLAENNLLVFKDVFKKLNRHQIPVFCMLAEAFVCFCYLALSKGNNIILQQTGAVCVTICYTLSLFSLLYLKSKSLLAWVGSACSIILLISATASSIKNNPLSIAVVAAIIAIGLINLRLSKVQNG